jgi:hypothetical protein
MTRPRQLPHDLQADDRAARPQPSTLHPNDAALQAIADAREAALFTQTAVDHLLQIAERQDRPAEMRRIRIPDASGSNPTNDRHRNAYKSLGIWVPAAGVAGGNLNPNGVGVYVGTGGNSARTGNDVPFVPPGGAVVLPISDIDVELGADPTVLLASFVVCFAFFYDSVQELYVR